MTVANLANCCWEHRRLGMPLVALLLLAGLPAYRAQAGDWPQWLGPQRNSVSGETLAPWEGEPRVVWKQPVGNAFSSPVVADGMIYTHAGVEGKDEEEVTAFDATTGKRLWHDIYPRAAYRSVLGTGPRSTPTVAGGRLYTLGVTGVLSCYDAKTGQRHWQVNPYEEHKTAIPNFGVCSSPLVTDGKIIFPVGGEGTGIVAYDAQTGKLAWKMLDEPAAAASPVLLPPAGDRQHTEVVVQTTLRLLGIEPVTGRIRWEHPLVFQPSGVSPTPLVQDNILICSTQDNGTLALDVAKPSDGAVDLKWWNQDVASYFSSGAVGQQGRVYIVTNLVDPLPRTDLRCLETASGNELWHAPGLGYFHVGVIHLADGKLLLLDDAGYLVLADTAGNRYRQLCKSKVCDGTFMNPVLSNGRIYVRDPKHLMCLEVGLAPANDAAAESKP